MATYIDFAFYSETYGGVDVLQSEFVPLATKASAVIDYVTFDKAAATIEEDLDADLIEKIKFATCAVMDEIRLIQSRGGVVASESVGSHSISYAVAKGTKNQTLTDAAKIYLANTGLMYRGF